MKCPLRVLNMDKRQWFCITVCVCAKVPWSSFVPSVKNSWGKPAMMVRFQQVPHAYNIVVPVVANAAPELRIQ